MVSLTHLFVEAAAHQLVVRYKVVAEVADSVVINIGNDHLVAASDVRI